MVLVQVEKQQMTALGLSHAVKPKQSKERNYKADTEVSLQARLHIYLVQPYYKTNIGLYKP